MVIFFIFHFTRNSKNSDQLELYTVHRVARENLNYGLRVCRIFSCVYLLVVQQRESDSIPGNVSANNAGEEDEDEDDSTFVVVDDDEDEETLTLETEEEDSLPAPPPAPARARNK